jgi:hypothetical protein
MQAIPGADSCSYNTPSAAVFQNFVAYGNEKGAEWVKANNIQFRGFVVYDHDSEAIAAKTIVGNPNVNTGYMSTFFSPSLGPAVADSFIIGNSINTASTNTPIGITPAWDRGELIQNVSFINFPNNDTMAIRPPIIVGTCM